jgi:hypothetical protein
MSAGARNASFRERFRIRASEMGPDAQLRLPALFDLFQEVAGNHATAFGWGSDVLLARGQEASDATRVLLSREMDGKEVARAVLASSV